jgi:predicted nucleic acid-binding protein
MKTLLDASAVLEVIKNFQDEKALQVFDDSYVLDLTKYEVGNGIWKEYALQHAIQEDEFQEFLDSLRTVVDRAKLLVPDSTNLLEIAKIAAKEKITFYEASYVAMAKVRKLVLTTEDSKLSKVASRHAKTRSSVDLVSRT